MDFFFLRAATIATFFAFFFALFSTKKFMTLLASLVAFLAGMLTLISFAIDIALFALVRHELDRLGAGITTTTGPGVSIPPFLRLPHHLGLTYFVIHSFPSRLLNRFLVDFCLPRAASRRWLHCMFRTSPAQEEALWCNKYQLEGVIPNCRTLSLQLQSPRWWTFFFNIHVPFTIWQISYLKMKSVLVLQSNDLPFCFSFLFWELRYIDTIIIS